MKAYIIPFLVYILTIPVINYFFHNTYISYTSKVILTGALIFFYRKEYKLKLKANLLSFLTGVLIFIIWIGLEGHYPLLAKAEFIPANSFALIIKLLGLIIIAPLIEELFTRSFLIRYFVNKNWKKVPIGQFTWSSFIITALFFGFSHNRWLAGLIAGILLNLLLYKKKNIGSCIFAHFIANLSLAIYVLMTSSWFMW